MEIKSKYKRVVTLKRRYEGEALPKWYGVAYRDYVTDCDICYPIPLNHLVKHLRLLKWRLYKPARDHIERQMMTMYHKGYNDGFYEGRNKKLLEVEDADSNHRDVVDARNAIDELLGLLNGNT